MDVSVPFTYWCACRSRKTIFHIWFSLCHSGHWEMMPPCCSDCWSCCETKNLTELNISKCIKGKANKDDAKSLTERPRQNAIDSISQGDRYWEFGETGLEFLRLRTKEEELPGGGAMVTSVSFCPFDHHCIWAKNTQNYSNDRNITRNDLIKKCSPGTTCKFRNAIIFWKSNWNVLTLYSIK